MRQYDYDLFVIGAGSGGVRASRMAAQLGARVAIAEERYLGGTCVNVGCVPKKLFVYGSHYSEAFHSALGFGWHPGAVRFNWQELRDNKNREIERLNGVYRRLLASAGVELLEGRAVLVDPHRVSVNGREYSAERILLAAGGWPWVPDISGSELAITSNDAFFLDQLPLSIVIVGGGYIAVEFAGIFNGLGVETHLCYRGDLFLRGFDQDVREFVAEQIGLKGVQLHFNTEIDRIEKTARGELCVDARDGRQWSVGQVMFATGRKPMTDGLGLEHTAVSIDEHGVVNVNDDFQTAEPSVYALGDMIGRMELTPVALAEATVFAQSVFGDRQERLDYRNIPSAVFCQPAIATVGLTEAQAREEFGAVDVYMTRFRPMQFALSDVQEKTLMKLIVDRASDRVVGCHMVGPEAGEVVQGLAVAMQAGATKADFDNTIGIHPTLAEEFVTMREPVR
jgi:glutathione reductase (NADPH)